LVSAEHRESRSFQNALVGSPRLEVLVWLFLLLALGAGLAFLSLELIGIPLVLIALGIIVWAGRRTGTTHTALMSFGVGFVGSVSFFALRGFFSPDTSGRLWFVVYFAFGVAMIAAGLGLYLLGPRRQ
jgi:hypothetical protein